jgi:hypothetical protein
MHYIFARQEDIDRMNKYNERHQFELQSPKLKIRIRDDAPITSLTGMNGTLFKGKAQWEPRSYVNYWKNMGWVEILEVEPDSEEDVELASVRVIKGKTIMWQNKERKSGNYKMVLPREVASKFEDEGSVEVRNVFVGSKSRITV